MLKFAEWVRTTRGTNTQASCAVRAGMTPQQWNQIEKLVRQPNVETVKRVAVGLCVEENTALYAAGYDTGAEEIDVRLARRLEPILLQVPIANRPAIEAAIEQAARTMAGLVTAPNP